MGPSQNRSCGSCLNATGYVGRAEVSNASGSAKSRFASSSRKLTSSNESLLVHKENWGVRNVIMYVYTGRGGSKLPAVHPESVGKKDVEISARECRIEPRIALLQAGDDLIGNYSDPIGHNFNISFFANLPIGPTIPVSEDGKTQRSVPKAEPAPIPVECNVHPWMKGYLIITDHPYAAVSDENGVLVIENLPAGAKLSFRLWHEVGNRLEGVEVGGTKVSRVNRVEIPIAPGVNDLGEVTLAAERFHRE